MNRLAERVADKRVLRLIRRYLQAGVLAHGVHSERVEGTPQGGPLSPLLANVLLDEVDRELERRGHKFVRYADDCNVYVRSRKAGERVLQALRGCYARLALRVNESKTAVDAQAHPAAHAAHAGAQPPTNRTEDLRDYVPGWKAYFRLAQTPGVMRELDGWLQHRLRAKQLKQWRRGTTMFRELRKLGVTPDQAARIAGNARSWWHNSAMGLNRAMPVAYFDRLGIPRFS